MLPHPNAVVGKLTKPGAEACMLLDPNAEVGKLTKPSAEACMLLDPSTSDECAATLKHRG